MDLNEASLHCDKSLAQYAKHHNIKRYDEFYLLKMQEQLGELSRVFLELQNADRKTHPNIEQVLKKFSGDCATLVGNALVLALHFEVNLEKALLERFPVEEPNSL